MALHFAFIICMALTLGVVASARPDLGISATRQAQEIYITAATEDNRDDSINVAFGSCYGKPGYHSDIFSSIVDDSPDLFIWLGDVTYMSSRDPERAKNPAAYYKNRLQETKDAAGYRKLEEKVPIIGVWDDNDYGKNNGGRHFREKDQNRELWLDFIGEA